MAPVITEVRHKHASINTIMVCLYNYYIHGTSVKRLAKIFVKDQATIVNWIEKFKKGGEYARKQKRIVYHKFGQTKRDWLVGLYLKKPILYLREAQVLFKEEFGTSISLASVSTILREANLTYKTLQRRAIEIQTKDIQRFSDELNGLVWLPHNLVFLDEVGFDNRGILRKRVMDYRANV